jgi:plasmid stabilization system protein ParE
MKRLAFTPHALARFDDILAFSVERFGPARAVQYLDDIEQRCRGLRSGKTSSQSCRTVIGAHVRADLRLARAGGHFIIFTETDAEVRIIDIGHQSANLARRLKDLP